MQDFIAADADNDGCVTSDEILKVMESVGVKVKTIYNFISTSNPWEP